MSAENASKVVDTVLDEHSIKVGVVGIGNAGGQVAMAAIRNGYDGIVLNTSLKDLDDKVLGDKVPALKIGDGRGSGKTRENAMALLKTNGNATIKEILTHPRFRGVVETADVVFVLFSTGGGTGSGIGPFMTETLRKAYKGKLIISYGILPTLNESALAQANMIACVNEMATGNGPYMLAGLKYYENLTMEKAYEKIAADMVKRMNVIRGDYFHMSSAGMADERDLLTVISESGYMCIQMIEGLVETNMTQTLQGYLVNEFKNSMVPCQHDGVVSMNLIVANVPIQFEDPLKTGDFNELNAYVGEPKGTFSNYAPDPMRASADVMCISSGMSIPMDRFAAPWAKIEANQNRNRSSLSLESDAKTASAFGSSNDATKSIVMGSKASSEADLSFLD